MVVLANNSVWLTSHTLSKRMLKKKVGKRQLSKYVMSKLRNWQFIVEEIDPLEDF